MLDVIYATKKLYFDVQTVAKVVSRQFARIQSNQWSYTYG